MMDTSDGLAISLHDLSQSSQVGFRIYEEILPISHEVLSLTNKNQVNEFALYSGGDFELLFTISPNMEHLVRKSCEFQIIGEVTGPDDGIILEHTDKSQEIINRKGYEQL